MEAHKSIWTCGCFSQGIDAQRRGVRCENRVFSTGFIECVENGRFYIKILEDRFDDEVGIGCNILNAHNSCDSALNLFDLGLREDSSLHSFS
jgi:hypothetical protein